MSSNKIRVSVGVILNDDGSVLLAKRPENVHQGGLWEFPGGKQENGENNEQALSREMYEELGISVYKARPFINLHHDYTDKSVELDVWLIQEWQGDVYGKEGQKIEWVDLSRLSELEFPAANHAIVKALQLPPLYLICPGPQGDINAFFNRIEECIQAGVRLLQLRCKQETLKETPDLVRQILNICDSYNARFLLNSSPATAAGLNIHGVHLNSVRLLQLNERPLSKQYLISASCHNQSELLHAEKLGLDFVVLSPVKKTGSHPGAKPLGWEKFNSLTKTTNLPVYALGGMQPTHIDIAWNHGAQGIAMLSGIWCSNNPSERIKTCLNF